MVNLNIVYFKYQSNVNRVTFIFVHEKFKKFYMINSTSYSDFQTDQTFSVLLFCFWADTTFDIYRTANGSHCAFAMGVAWQQGMHTHLDTLFRLIWGFSSA